MRLPFPHAKLVALLSATALPAFLADLMGGEALSAWALYALPVVLAAWLGGRRWALGLVALAIALNWVASSLSGHPFNSTLGLLDALVNRAIVLGVVAVLADRARLVDMQQSIAQSIETEA